MDACGCEGPQPIGDEAQTLERLPATHALIQASEFLSSKPSKSPTMHVSDLRAGPAPAGPLRAWRGRSAEGAGALPTRSLWCLADGLGLERQLGAERAHQPRPILGGAPGEAHVARQAERRAVAHQHAMILEQPVLEARRVTHVHQ